LTDSLRKHLAERPEKTSIKIQRIFTSREQQDCGTNDQSVSSLNLNNEVLFAVVEFFNSVRIKSKIISFSNE
jgi:hypothetical protein